MIQYLGLCEKAQRLCHVILYFWEVFFFFLTKTFFKNPLSFDDGELLRDRSIFTSLQQQVQFILGSVVLYEGRWFYSVHVFILRFLLSGCLRAAAESDGQGGEWRGGLTLVGWSVDTVICLQCKWVIDGKYGSWLELTRNNVVNNDFNFLSKNNLCTPQWAVTF